MDFWKYDINMIKKNLWLEVLYSICLEEMDEEEGNMFKVPACSHTYHIDCIAKWKKTSRKCPCCRGALPEDLGPTSELQNMSFSEFPQREVPQNMSTSDIFGNIAFSLVGVTYPLLLCSFCLAFGTILLGPVIAIILVILTISFFDDKRSDLKIGKVGPFCNISSLVLFSPFHK